MTSFTNAPVPNSIPAAASSSNNSTTGMRMGLPNRAVADDTIEDAFVAFIFYCNPGMPFDSEITALREAFRMPPRSDGKSFSIFHLYQLIQQLESKEIKTWVELALRLGVEPPDSSKGQSSQKIQQYAVRLKRWMHSMHVDAFFEYLIGREHSYWTQVPTDPNPVMAAGRDGVAPEDDMVLRALLPHIRPRRGRKRADEEDHHIPPSRRRADSPSSFTHHNDDGSSDQWPTHQGNHLNPSQAGGQQQQRNFGFLSESLRPNAAWEGNVDLQTPLTTHPHSAITPSTPHMFWVDEPRSAIIPGTAQRPKKRYGAKAVSSAWRSTSKGKTRGRPPANRKPVDGTFGGFGSGIQIIESVFPPVQEDNGSGKQSSAEPMSEQGSSAPSQVLPYSAHSVNPTYGQDQSQQHQQQYMQYQQHLQHHLQQQQHHQQQMQSQYQMQYQMQSQYQAQSQQRPPKPSISLQVPQRNNTVRLATPPTYGHHHIFTPNTSTMPSIGVRGPSYTHPYAPNSPASTPSVTINGESMPAPGAHGRLSPASSQPALNTISYDNEPSDSNDNTNKPMLPNFPTEAFPPKPTINNELEFPSLPLTNPPPSVHGTNPDQFPNPFRNPEDTTNLESLYNFLLIRSLGAEWIGPDGEPDYPADVTESRRIVDATFVDLHRKAKTKETFLINVAVLAGGKILVHKRPRFQRLEVTDAYTRYLLAWEYRLGSLTAAFTSKAVVYKNKAAAEAAADTAASRHFEKRDAPPSDGDPKVLSEYWKRKYTELLQLTAKEEMEDQVIHQLVRGTRECVTGTKTYGGGQG